MELTPQERANALWQVLDDTLRYYDTVACPCAFPRFRQYAEIDCVDYGGSFYFSETEGFIQLSADRFDTDPGNPSLRTCKKCGSTYSFDWQDFSIHVSRSTLRLLELKRDEIGAPALQPIPFYFGPVGHRNPDKSLFQYYALEDFTTYLRERRT